MTRGEGRVGEVGVFVVAIGNHRRRASCSRARVQVRARAKLASIFFAARRASRQIQITQLAERERGGRTRKRKKRERGNARARERKRWREFGLFPSDAAGLLALLPRAWSRIYAGKKVCFHLFLLILTARAHRSPQPRSSAAPGATGRASVCDHQLSHIERRAALRRTRRSRFRCFGWRVSGAREAVRRRRPIDGGSSSATARA